MIKKFDPSKADKIMDIWLSANLAAHPFVHKEYFINAADRMQGVLSETDVIVYERDNRILGFSGAMPNGYLACGLFVKEGFRNEGIGDALVNALKERYNKLQLHVYKANDKAVAFFKRRGFEVQTEGLNEETRQVEYLMSWKK